MAVALNSYDKSPFYSRIKRLGTATAGKFTETLTQATFVEAFIGYLTDDKVSDRDLYRRHKKPKLDESKDGQINLPIALLTRARPGNNRHYQQLLFRCGRAMAHCMAYRRRRADLKQDERFSRTRSILETCLSAPALEGGKSRQKRIS